MRYYFAERMRLTCKLLGSQTGSHSIWMKRICMMNLVPTLVQMSVEPMILIRRASQMNGKRKCRNLKQSCEWTKVVHSAMLSRDFVSLSDISSTSIVLHEDKKYYPDAEEVYPGVEGTH